MFSAKTGQRSRIVKFTVIIILFFCQTLFSEPIGNNSETTTPDLAEAAISDFEDSDFFDTDFEDSEMADDEFEEEAEPETETDSSQSRPPLSLLSNLNGFLIFTASGNLSQEEPSTGDPDYRGLSELKTEGMIGYQADLYRSWACYLSGEGYYDASYAVNDRKNIPSEVLDEYESNAELREAWIRGKLSERIDIKAGRQIVVWGKSDRFLLTDILCPFDLRKPAPIDVNDLDRLRLPVAMTKTDVFFEQFTLSAIAIHERRFHKSPAFGSPFYPAPDLPPPDVEEPSDEISNTEYAASLSGTFSGWDATLYAADLYEKTPYLNFEAWDRPLLKYARIKMAGADLNLAAGNFLFKTEGAFFNGVRLNDAFNGTTIIRISDNNHRRINLMAGIEYTGLTNTALILEVMKEHIQDIGPPEIAAGVSQDTVQTAVRASRTFFNERIETILSGLFIGEKAEKGYMYRFTADYEMTDTLLLTGDLVIYEDGDAPLFQNYKDNDYISVQLKLSF